jgi:uncharacterized protein YjbJ (UPF0337 family)
MEDKMKGRMKEAAGAITGDEDLKAEGQALQRKGAAKAKQAERQREEQELKDKGLLGNVGDNLLGR